MGDDVPKPKPSASSATEIIGTEAGRSAPPETAKLGPEGPLPYESSKPAPVPPPSGSVDRAAFARFLASRGGRLTGISMQGSRFSDLNCLGVDFETVHFGGGSFDSCYFRNSKFHLVNFTGCRFRDCRFDGATFSSCDLKYAEFHNCNITYAQVANCLPEWHNARRNLARALRVNAQERGEMDESRRFLLEELRASKIHNRKTAFGWFLNDDFYKAKYEFADRLTALRTWVGLNISGAFWGYGEHPFRVIAVAAILIAGFSGVFRFSVFKMKNWPGNAGFLEYLGLSASSFASVSYGDIIPENLWARLLVTFEGIFGLVMFGFLVSALYRRISKR
jgi:hypothetical protein